MGAAANAWCFGEFNDHYDDAGRWTRADPQDFAEEQARDVAGHVVHQIQQDAEFVFAAYARRFGERPFDTLRGQR